ncbi:hypothetical protein [Streptomyces sp. CS065A]|uniref:hypothetical protein n=1 Tax=unclassified Streptomyces TaxID=2593676 RepID=UPI000D51E144|nr:hypothetical protein [Streptomyces sp. CS065A]PVC62977.1 hypothetical protein DBP15_28575 [Streptomyces sp. CS065A]
MPDLTQAVQLSDPLRTLEPVPFFACDVCASLGRQREAARKLGDLSTVSDCNIEIRRHPHEGDR